MTNQITFEKNSFSKRLKSMLTIDFRRMFTTPLFYLMVGICLVMPILILVMTSMMDGTVNVNPQTGETTVIEGFKNVWQIIGTASSASADAASAGMQMDLTSMCNINLVYFISSVFVCLFVSDDFRSGYAKNLFTVRAKKNDYVISKTLSCLVCGISMLIAFFVGAMIGGAISSLSFELVGTSVGGVVMCMLSKLLLMAVFIAIFLTVSVACKQKSWLSIICSLGASMLLFAMVPMITPINATFLNVVLCLAGGAMFAFGLGYVSDLILRKTNIL